MSFYTSNYYFVILLQMFKSNPTTNRPFQTSIIIPRYKVPLTKIIFVVLFGISDLNSDIPISSRGPGHTKNQPEPELTFRRKRKPNFYYLFGLLTGTPFKSESGLLRTYSLRYLTHNSLKRRFRQPLCDPRYLRKLDERENQSLDDSLDYGQRPWGISRGVTDQQSTRFHSN